MAGHGRGDCFQQRGRSFLVYNEVELMHTIQVTDYTKLWSAICQWEPMTAFPKDSQVRFLDSLGYKSAEWLDGATFRFSLNDADYTWFLLKWT